MINDTRDKTLEMLGKRTTEKNENSGVADDQLMEEEKKDAASDKKVKDAEEKKSDSKEVESGHAKTRIEFVEPPSISQQPSSDDP